jgi:hypothetical protein
LFKKFIERHIFYGSGGKKANEKKKRKLKSQFGGPELPDKHLNLLFLFPFYPFMSNELCVCSFLSKHVSVSIIVPNFIKIKIILCCILLRHTPLMIQLHVGSRDASNTCLNTLREQEILQTSHVCACYNVTCKFIDRSEHVLLYLSSTQFGSYPFFALWECVKSKLKTMFTEALGAFTTITKRNVENEVEIQIIIDEVECRVVEI